MFATVFLAAAAWSRSNERFCEPSSSEVPDRSVDHVRTATEGLHAACPRGALIATRTRGRSRGRHRVACPRGAMLRFGARSSDHHPTGVNPAVMNSASLVAIVVRRGRAPSKRTAVWLRTTIRTLRSEPGVATAAKRWLRLSSDEHEHRSPRRSEHVHGTFRSTMGQNLRLTANLTAWVDQNHSSKIFLTCGFETF